MNGCIWFDECGFDCSPLCPRYTPVSMKNGENRNSNDTSDENKCERNNVCDTFRDE